MAGLIADPFRAARLLLHLRQEGVTDPRVLDLPDAAAVKAEVRRFVDKL